MKKLALAIASLWLVFAPPAFAANVNIDGLPAATSVAGADLLECEQSGVNNKCTPAQMAAYVYGLMSADATASGTGAVTLKTVNSNVGSFGSTTQCAAITVNAKGLITAISAATCAPAVGSITGFATGIGVWLAAPSSANLLAALTTKTGTGNAVFGSAPTIDSLNATTALTLAFLTGSTQCLQVNSSGAVSGTGSACGSGGSSGANPSATAGPTANNGTSPNFMRADASPAVQTCSASQPGLCQPDGTTIKVAAGVISAAPQVGSRTVTGTTDTLLSTDLGNIVYYNSASPVAVSIPQAGTTGFAANDYFGFCNINAGLVTGTPTTSTIGGQATLPLTAGTASHPNCTWFRADSTNNYTIADKVVGAGVTGAMGAALSSAGGLTSTIANGTAALGTSAIASAACATAVAATATGVATTDTVTASFNGDPTAVTGYIPSTSGMLTIFAYPTSGNVNFKVCNNTSASVTPGALTLNWRVTR